MIDVELTATWSDIWLAVASTAAIFAAVITYTRIVGLRSFSKMSSFDFAMTVAVGSLMAAVGMGNSSLPVGLAVLTSLYGIQFAIAFARRRWTAVADIVDNQPVLLMAGDRLLEDNLAETRVTKADVVAKLREANVLNLDQVKAVVLEATGDIAVLHGAPDEDFDHEHVCHGVRDAALLNPEGDHAPGGVPAGSWWD